MKGGKRQETGSPIRHRKRCCAIFWRVVIACSAYTVTLLNAAVIDDFSGPTKKFLTGGGGMDYMHADLVDGQLLFSGDYPGPSSPSTPLTQYDNIYWPSSLPVVDLNGRTLELRMDLVSTSADDVYLLVGLDGSSGGYGVFVDQDEVALIKYSDAGNAVFCWTNAPVAKSNVTAILSVTQMTNTVFLTMRFVERGSDRVLYESSFSDGPGRDFQAVTPRPKGMSIFGPDQGLALTNFSIVFAGVFQWATNDPPPLEVVLDNLEYDLYDVPQLKVENSVLLSWSKNTAEEQIVVGTDSLAESVWAPWPEPIFMRNGELCMAVPAAAKQQFFKLAPGIQYADAFTPGPRWPYRSRDDWVIQFANAADSTRFVCTNVDGALRIHTVKAAVDGRFVVLPPGPDVVVGDFIASVDILKWPIRGREAGIWARGAINRASLLDGSNGYMATASRERGRLLIWDGGADVPGTALTYNTSANYRLVFSAVGPDLSLLWVNLKTGIASDMKLTNTKWDRGPVALYLDAMAGGSLDITLDNFFVTGTKPTP